MRSDSLQLILSSSKKDKWWWKVNLNETRIKLLLARYAKL